MTAYDPANPPQRFERDLREALHAEAGIERPDYLPDVLVQTLVARQRPAWTFPSRSIPMTFLTTRYPATAGIPWRAFALLVVLALLVAALGLAYVGSRPRLPAPYGPAGNGLVAYASRGDIFVADPGHRREPADPDRRRQQFGPAVVDRRHPDRVRSRGREQPDPVRHERRWFRGPPGRQ